MSPLSLEEFRELTIGDFLEGDMGPEDIADIAAEDAVQYHEKRLGIDIKFEFCSLTVFENAEQIFEEVVDRYPWQRKEIFAKYWFKLREDTITERYDGRYFQPVFNQGKRVKTGGTSYINIGSNVPLMNENRCVVLPSLMNLDDADPNRLLSSLSRHEYHHIWQISNEEVESNELFPYAVVFDTQFGEEFWDSLIANNYVALKSNESKKNIDDFIDDLPTSVIQSLKPAVEFREAILNSYSDTGDSVSDIPDFVSKYNSLRQDYSQEKAIEKIFTEGQREIFGSDS